MKRIALLIPFFLLVIMYNARGEWNVLKTDNFSVFYRPGYELQAQWALGALEYYRPQIERLTGNRAKRVSILIEDVGTLANGASDPLFNRILLFTYPPSLSEYVQNWWIDLTVHEYTHHLHLTNTSGFPRVLRSVFGTPFNPNLVSPPWMYEAITVYSESQISPFQGRLNDGFYDAYMAARVKEGRFPTIVNASYSPLEMPLDGIYLYGGEFFKYLGQRYGERRFPHLFTSYGSSLNFLFTPFFPGLGIDTISREAFGKSFPKLWKDWQEYLAKEADDFTVEGQRVTDRGWRTDNPRLSAHTLYYKTFDRLKVGAFDSYSRNMILAYDTATGREKIVVRSNSHISLPITVKDDQLYYGTLETRRGFANTSLSRFGFYSLVHKKDLKTGSDRVLFGDLIRGYAVLVDDTIIYSVDRKEGFGSRILIFNPQTREKALVLTTDYLVDSFLVGGDRIVVNARKDGSNSGIYVLELESKELKPIIDTSYKELASDLREDALFFGANFNGIYGAYRYNLASQEISRLTQSSFADAPVYDPVNGQIYYVGLTSYGTDIFKEQFQPGDFQLPETENIILEPKIVDPGLVREGSYWDNVKTLVPKIRLPCLYFDRDIRAAGLLLVGGDAIGHFPNYTVTVLYDFEQREPAGSLRISSLLLAPLSTDVDLGNIDEEYLQLSLSYPLLKRLSAGLNEIAIGTACRLSEERLKTKELIPSFSIAFGYPTSRFVFDLAVPIESEAWGSASNRQGFYGDFLYDQYLRSNKASLGLSGIYDPDDSDVVPLIRGYSETIDASVGGTGSLEYTRPLIRIRKGLWNPNFFLEDVTGLVFVDGAWGEGVDYQLSAGLELHLETKLLLGNVDLDQGLRLVTNREYETTLEYFVRTLF